jgi:plastocyanin
MRINQSIEKYPARDIVVAAVIACTAMTLAACGKSASQMASAAQSSAQSSAKPTTVTVRLQNIAIHPSKVTIQKGSSVKWVWLDKDLDTPHNVTPSSGSANRFKASGTRISGSYTVRFEKAGIYRYECTIHPASMQGTVAVHQID